MVKVEDFYCSKSGGFSLDEKILRRKWRKWRIFHFYIPLNPFIYCTEHHHWACGGAQIQSGGSGGFFKKTPLFIKKTLEKSGGLCIIVLRNRIKTPLKKKWRIIKSGGKKVSKVEDFYNKQFHNKRKDVVICQSQEFLTLCNT